jgi:antitoxin YefM
MPKDQRSFGRQINSFVKAYLLDLYGIPVPLVIKMNTVSVNQFREKLKTFVEQVVTNHTPLKVTRRAGEAFVVMSADDWEREQETLFVLQNTSLMKQIADSAATHTKGSGYKPTSEEIDEITGI